MHLPKNIVAGNWKMNKNYADGIALVKEIIANNEKETEEYEIILNVPFIHLKEAADLTKDYKHIAIGAQDCHTENAGAYTGNISAEMLQSCGVKYVIIGHSERRMYHNENSEILNKKIAQAFENQLKVIFCIGEPLEEREAGKHNAFIQKQLEETLLKLNKEDLKNSIIAYEPIWAIGTGKTATSDQAQDMHAFIRNLFAEKFDEATANSLSILYGGSCNPTNAKELFSQEDINGGLIGGASLKSEDFQAIIESF